MPYCVYILQSESSFRYYCGQTNNLGLRIEEHNDPLYRGTRTANAFEGPWLLVWTRQCTSRSEAMILERKIEKRGIGRYLADQGNVQPSGGC